MKTDILITCLSICLIILLSLDLKAQNIRNDTIHVSSDSEVELIFRSPSNATLVNLDGSMNTEGLYVIGGGSKTSITVRASKKGVKDVLMIVNEGPREHIFVLSYKEGLPASRKDWSNLRKLKSYASEKETRLNNALSEAETLFNRQQWEQASEKYRQLLIFVDPKTKSVVDARMKEINMHIQDTKQKKYEEMMNMAKSHFEKNRYEEAKKFYLQALEYKPQDALALKNISFIDNLMFENFLKKGDEYNNARNFIAAKTNYEAALKIKPNDNATKVKRDLVKKKADPLIYDIEIKEGDEAYRLYELDSARLAYDSALSVKPNDKDILERIKKLNARKLEVEQRKKKELEYYNILAKAKNLENKASNKQGYDQAIMEYKKAIQMFPGRKFPADRIKILNKLKDGIIGSQARQN